MTAMSMIVEVPEPLAGRLAAEAARRGVSIDQLTVEALHEHLNDHDHDHSDETPGSLGAFIGSFDSGDPDWAGTDTHTLRVDTATRRPA
jgi:hypothetical protein